jgi:hypothetical protein
MQVIRLYRNRFHRKGFATVNPLHIKNSTLLVILILIILNCIPRQKGFKNEQYKVILKLFKASQTLKNRPNRERIKNFATIKKSKDLLVNNIIRIKMLNEMIF